MYITKSEGCIGQNKTQNAKYNIPDINTIKNEIGEKTYRRQY